MMKAPRNRTITLSDKEREIYRAKLIKIDVPVSVDQILNKVINQDIYKAVDFLPSEFVDILFVDPPL